MTRAALCVVVAIGLAASAGCGTSSNPVAHRSPSPQPSATASPGGTIKPALGGLLDRDGPPPSEFYGVMGGFVVNVHWADLQPQRGGPIQPGNAIDQAIAALHAIDPSGKMGLKIRLFAGQYAPDWAKAMDGAPITVRDPLSGQTGTIGRFWTEDFGTAYSDLMSKLAAQYDSAPEVREVTISRCTTIFAEPFVRDAADPSSVQAMLAAGYTVTADKTCEREQVQSHLVWQHTRSDLSFNPFQLIDGTGRSDEAFSESMMDYCRATLGDRCVLENNSLRVPLQFPDLYAHIQELGAPIAFQTAVLARVGDLGTTLETAISLGAGSVELPAGFQSTPVATLAMFDSHLAAQAPSH